MEKKFNGCWHEGVSFERLYLKWVAVCEICGNIRIKKKNDVFWKGTLKTVVILTKRSKNKKIRLIGIGVSKKMLARYADACGLFLLRIKKCLDTCK